MRIILTGGGTAGHIWPIIAICKEFKKQESIYLYVGSRGGLEQKISSEKSINFRAISVGKIRNYFSFLNFIDPFKILFGLVESYFIIKKFKPDVIFSKGGYVAVPVLFWAKTMKIPTVLHESDAVIGKTTRWGSKFAKSVCTGFPVENYNLDNLPVEKFIYTGIPLRSEFINAVPTSQSDIETILITGGSQGSAKINGVVFEILNELLANYRVIHLTGERDFSKFSVIKNKNYEVFSFTEQMPELLKAADLIVTRSGSTMAEISYLAKPSILIPLSTASLKHQEANANFYARHNAAEVIYEKDLTPTNLLNTINQVMKNDHKRRELSDNIKMLSKPNAVKEIIIVIKEAIKL